MVSASSSPCSFSFPSTIFPGSSLCRRRIDVCLDWLFCSLGHLKIPKNKNVYTCFDERWGRVTTRRKHDETGHRQGSLYHFPSWWSYRGHNKYETKLRPLTLPSSFTCRALNRVTHDSLRQGPWYLYDLHTPTSCGDLLPEHG